jgi:hypothetical protein
MPTVKKTIELDQEAINRTKTALNAETEKESTREHSDSIRAYRVPGSPGSS